MLKKYEIGSYFDGFVRVDLDTVSYQIRKTSNFNTDPSVYLD